MGLVVVYKATTVVNFAHGELFMVGGFLAYTFHVLLKLGYVVSLVLAVAAALLAGIRVDRVYAFTWAAGAATGAAAAVLMAPLTFVYPDVGSPLLVKAFAAAVLGGFGSLPGAVLGGFSIGLIENLAGGYIHTSFTDISAFLVIMVVLVVRPTGFFGPRAVRRI